MSIPADSDRGWRTVYAVGGATAFLTLAMLLFDIVLAMVPGWGTSTVPSSAGAWFAQFAATPLLGLRNLDLLNVVASLLALPLYVAIHGALRDTEPGLAITGLLVVALGTAVFAASNAALPMLELSRRYAGASPAAQASLLSAADALLAGGAHGSYGAYPGFLLSEIGTLVTGIALLRSGRFGKPVAWIGIAGVSILLGYTTAFTFGSGDSTLVMAAAAPGGLLMIAWYALVGRRLLRLARAADACTARIASVPAGA